MNKIDLNQIDFSFVRTNPAAFIYKGASVEITHTFQCTEEIDGKCSWYGYLTVLVNGNEVNPDEHLSASEAEHLSEVVQAEDDPRNPNRKFASNPRVVHLIEKMVDRYIARQG